MRAGVGPLSGLRIIELASVGPGPHAAMMLADYGADVVRIDRPDAEQFGRPDATDPMLRGRRRVEINLKSIDGKNELFQLAKQADVLIEGYRPGVVERLGVGPDDLLPVNPRLVYARVTGWGQVGPLSHLGGHDINYLSLTGVLHSLGGANECPAPPLNLVADYGGGSMFLLTGILAAVWNSARTGRGEVIDCAMVDGVASLSQKVWSLRAQGRWIDARESNIIDGHAPWYRTYRCADGKFMAVGAIEAKFYSSLIRGLGLEGKDLPDQHDRHGWPKLTKLFEEVFRAKTRDEWASIFVSLDACATPVLTWAEAPRHPQLAARGTLVYANGAHQASPAPRFRETPLTLPTPMSDPTPLEDVLLRWT